MEVGVLLMYSGNFRKLAGVLEERVWGVAKCWMGWRRGGGGGVFGIFEIFYMLLHFTPLPSCKGDSS